MAFAFPSATTVGQLYTYGATTWEWDGTVWNVQPSFGDVQLSITADNEIDTKTQDLILDSATGNTQIDDNLAVTGTLDVTGISTFTTDVSVGGALGVTGAATLGGTLGVTGATTLSDVVTSNNIVPLATATHDLGTSTNVWNNIYGSRVVLGDLTIDGATNTISSATNAIVIDPSPSGDGGDVTIAGNILITGSTTGGTSTLGNVTITGDLTVNGNTTTVNSTTVTLDDPVMTLGGDTAPTTNDGLDRGIEYRWHDGTSAKLGFFGWDHSVQKFTFMPDATNAGEVFSGTLGNVAFGSGDFTGNVSPTQDLTYDLGTPLLRWNNGYFDTLSVNNLSVPAVNFGNIQIAVTDAQTIDTTTGDLVLSSNSGTTTIVALSANINASLAVTGATTLSDALGVTGAATMSSTLAVTGATTLSDTLNVTGAATLSSTLAVTGFVTAGDSLAVINGATVGGTFGVIGASSLAGVAADSINPNANLSWDLGGAMLRWANLYAQTIQMNDPAFPTVSVPLTVQGNDLYVDGVKVGGACTVDTAAPASPDEGMMWLDRNSGILYIWVVDAGTGVGNWIQPL